MDPDTRFLYDAFFRFQEALRDVLTDIYSSEVHPDSRECHHLNTIFDQWTQLTGTIDADLACYPLWLHVVRLVEDLELVNHWMCVDRVQTILRLLQKPDYTNPAASACTSLTSSKRYYRRYRHTGPATTKPTSSPEIEFEAEAHQARHP